MHSILYYIVLYFKFHIRIFVYNQIDTVIYDNYLEIILYPFIHLFTHLFIYLTSISQTTTMMRQLVRLRNVYVR